MAGYREMTPAERIADRIAKNRRIEERAACGGRGLSLDGIVTRLHERRQRATYGAVAALAGVLPRGLMSGRPKDARNSWIVAATNGGESRRGWPTGYARDQIDAECYRQIVERAEDFIEDAEVLRRWLSEGER